ncbi:Histone-lysine N-methyltransferase SETMAR [Araneus ventricosus]|uniref:Histone-lysine N-methyltransferase SETMAR n=1 Tax=Araneus ventricosus TaxID=182803 RepID=A0A4Y2AYM7_ARAVE|nr:Histone-lysine N-methyltransferase SETMAR [Araneus ventricosus]
MIPAPGRPSVITDEMVASVEAKVLENRRFTISALSNDFPEVSRSVLYKIVSEKLNFKELCSRWVPKLLTEEHKNKRFECSLNFLTRYNEEGGAMLSRIVKGDETWVSHVTPESKQQSMEWSHTHFPVRVKAKQTLSQSKIIASVFWDRHSVLMVDFMQRGTTINAVAYGQTLRKLRTAIQNKRRGMLTDGILLLHDNARPCTAAQTRDLLDSFGWEILDHPMYIPDLAPSDFHLFRHLKHHLGGNHYNADEDVKTAMTSWLTEQAASFYEEGIQNLVVRYDKCLNKLGSFVEK